MTTKIIVEQKNYSCNKCEIEYSSKHQSDKNYYTSGKINVERLFTEYRDEGGCLVQWDKNQGFLVAIKIQ